MSRYKTGWSSRSGGWMIHNSSSIRYTGIGSGVVLSRANAKKGAQDPKTFEEIRDDCSTKGQLWEDPDFPATDSSIYFKNPPSVWPGIKWMRPKVLRPTALVWYGQNGINEIINQSINLAPTDNIIISLIQLPLE